MAPIPGTIYDPEGERGLLSACQDDARLLLQIAEVVRAEFFADLDHAASWERLLTAATAEQPLPHVIDAPPTLEPVATAIRLRGLLQMRALDNAQQVFGRSLKQVLAGSMTPEAAIAAFETGATLAREKGARTVSELQPAADCVSDLLGKVQTWRERNQAGQKIGGMSTGFPDLDEVINGLEPQSLVILGGKPGMGKTTLANMIAANVAYQDAPVLYVTYENTRDSLILKHIGRMAGVSETAIRRGAVEDLTVLQVMATEFGQKATRLYYTEAGPDTTVESIGAQCRQIQRRHCADRMLIVVDYLQKMAPMQGYDDLRASVGATTARLRELARDLNSCVLALASLNRDGYKPGTAPTLSNLKESGDIEYGADVVMLLYEGEGYDKEDERTAVTLDVAKNRGGESDKPIPMTFRAVTGDFTQGRLYRNEPARPNGARPNGRR